MWPPRDLQWPFRDHPWINYWIFFVTLFSLCIAGYEWFGEWGGIVAFWVGLPLLVGFWDLMERR